MNPIVRQIVDNADLRRKLMQLCAAAGSPLTKQAISDWKKSKSGVPPSRVLIVAKLLKLQPHDIRPDIFPPPGRSRKRHLKSGNHNHAQQRSVL